MTNPEMTTLDIGCWGCLGCASCGIGVSLLSALSEIGRASCRERV